MVRLEYGGLSSDMEPPGNFPVEDEPVYKGMSERHVLYPDPCEECGGTQWDVGGSSHYNGSFQCYTLYLECENCGRYDVECV